MQAWNIAQMMMLVFCSGFYLLRLLPAALRVFHLRFRAGLLQAPLVHIPAATAASNCCLHRVPAYHLIRPL